MTPQDPEPVIPERYLDLLESEPRPPYSPLHSGAKQPLPLPGGPRGGRPRGVRSGLGVHKLDGEEVFGHGRVLIPPTGRRTRSRVRQAAARYLHGLSPA